MVELTSHATRSRNNRHFLVSFARAQAGAIIFSLPLLMTMEMWDLAYALDPLNRGVMLITLFPLLIGLAHVFGFEETFGWQEDLIDAAVAIFVAFFTSAICLSLLGIIDYSTPFQEICGKIELQLLPGSMGALLARSQFGDHSRQEKDPNYLGELFIMGVGALFLSLSIAPTEEVLKVSSSFKPIHAFVLAIFSLIVMHAFVYRTEFSGSQKTKHMIPPWRLFLRFTVVGYAIVAMTSLFVLWVFGQTEDLSAFNVLTQVIVLGFPAAVGAASARLVL